MCTRVLGVCTPYVYQLQLNTHETEILLIDGVNRAIR